MKNEQQNKMLIYKTEDGKADITVRLEDENVWLNQQQMASLYQTSRTNVVEHIKHILEEGELTEEATCRKFRQVQTEGGRNVEREIPFYNLDMIISLGYRIKSRIATAFRIWATKRLNEYIRKGFVMDDERLKNSGGGNYWKELLDRIRDIRSSEKVLYRQVLDLYATSVDYDPNAGESIQFFKIVQNKLHYAAHGHTAAEVIVERAAAGRPFMGMLTFSGGEVTKKDIGIAKNYLSEKELKKLNNIVSAYFDLAEVKAMSQESMSMKDWIAQLDRMILSFDGKLLDDAGIVSHELAMQKAAAEYKKYQSTAISAAELAYLGTLSKVETIVKKNRKITGSDSKSVAKHYAETDQKKSFRP
ncbi:MAG: virulence RhuM family protein [Candidatus Omnitrophica bacterium]|nr:virulence RhuM family protein [Candidatus Omnitrophota bacterium]